MKIFGNNLKDEQVQSRFIGTYPTVRSHRAGGLTFVELLLALMVTGIILSAVASLAFALSEANESTRDMAEQQARVRFVTLKLQDLLRQSRLVCAVVGDDVVLWKADDNPQNGQMDLLELAYLETGDGEIKLLEFLSCSEAAAQSFRAMGDQIDVLGESSTKESIITRCEEQEVTLLEGCSDLTVTLDTTPPYTRKVGITFEVDEGGVVSTYQVNAALRCWAEHLINSDGSGLVRDDDE